MLLEYKGRKDALVKLNPEGHVDNRKNGNDLDHNSINKYAVNGAVHYANALLHHTGHEEVIAIGVTGHKDPSGALVTQIGVYYVCKDNFGVGQKIGEYDDLSFLKKENFGAFIEKINTLHLSPAELAEIKKQREQEIDDSLRKLNQEIYKGEENLSETDRVYLVAASIIATLGVPGSVVPLKAEDLKSTSEPGNTDGDIILRKVEAYLINKKLPNDKTELIKRTLKNTLTSASLNRVVNGETQLKRIFKRIVEDLGIYYKIGLTTDFTGKLFNEMYSWLGFTQDKLNDVVLTPAATATLLAKLARVHKDSYVWDFATGSAGLLVAAMNEMVDDARQNISSPDELNKKVAKIKAEQLLGLEVLHNIYMLAVLNMILMGDGSSNILNEDSLKFTGNYAYGRPNEKFPANAFILNPPYSAPGKGMIFVKKALSMMSSGYAAIIIQNSAGTGAAKEHNREILKKNTLLASIKMPIDLFVGKSSVQTYIYVFQVGEAHKPDNNVKFIDFSDDGYARSNRKKANSAINLKDTGNAKERYQEVVDLVLYGSKKLNHLTESEYYEGVIDPANGADWNKSAPIDTTPTLADLKKTVSEYLAWEVSQILKNSATTKDDKPEKIAAPLNQKFSNIEWGEFKIGELFYKVKTSSLKYNARSLPKNPTDTHTLPALTASSTNQGLAVFLPAEEEKHALSSVISIASNGAAGMTFYQPHKFAVLQDAYAINWCSPAKSHLNPNEYLFFTSIISQSLHNRFGWNFKATWSRVQDVQILLPITATGDIDFAFIEEFIAELEAQHLAELEAYLKVIRL